MVNFGAMRYLLHIRNTLPCSFQVKGKIMKRISDDVHDYLAVVPDANYDELLNRFGAPDGIAVAYVEDLESQEMLSVLRTRRSILKICKILAAIIVVVWVMVAGIALLDSFQQSGGYGVAYTVDGTIENNQVEE